MQQRSNPAGKKNRPRVWSGKKRLVLSPEAAKQRRAAFAQLQDHRAIELERVAALALHPDAVCSACGVPMFHEVKDDSGKIVGRRPAATCPKSCTALFGKQRSHGIVFEPQPLPNRDALVASLELEAKTKKEKGSAPPGSDPS